MILTAVLTAVSVFVAGVVVLFIGYTAYQREKREFIHSLRAYFESSNPDTPSQFAMLTEILSERFSQKLVNSLKSSFMGQQSVDAKNIQRLEGDLVQDLAGQQSPILGAILNSYPAVAKRLAKNPSLLPLVQSLMSKVSSGSAAQSAHPSDNSQDIFAIK